MNTTLLFAILLLLRVPTLCIGHARYLTDSRCSRQLDPGVVIMGRSAQRSSGRRIIVRRGSTELSSGDGYVPGESLTVSLSSTSGEYVFEATNGASFDGGGCTINGARTRRADRTATLVMPSSGSGQVTLKAGYANGFGTVSLAQEFSLKESVPTLDPTLAPTVKPTTASPTLLPTAVPSTAAPSLTPTTAAPSLTPTAKPTFSATAPTPLPSAKPTAAPSITPTSASPSFAPTFSPSNAPTAAPSELPTSTPTTALQTLVSFESSQTLFDVTFTDVNASTAASEIALVMALEQSLSAFDEKIYDIEVSSIEDSTDASRLPAVAAATTTAAATTHSSKAAAVAATPPKLALQNVPSVVVVFTLSYILQSTDYSTVDELEDAVELVMGVVMNSNLFVTDLQTAASDAGATALTAVSSSSLASVTTAAAVDIRTPEPVESSESYYFYGSGSSNAIDSSEDDLYEGSVESKVLPAVLVGAAGIVVLGYGLSNLLKTYDPSSSTGDNNSSSSSTPIGSFLAILPAYVAIALSCICVVLVALWTTKKVNSVDDVGFIGIPSWFGGNLFAWHPILMVAGFFFLQIQAICDWSLISHRLSAKAAHIFLQCGAVATMIAGLWAVVKDHLDNRTPSLTTMHSWIGVAAVAVFGFNFLYGISMGIITVKFPDSRLRQLYKLGAGHKFIGLVALALTVASIVSGIMDFLPQGLCYYEFDDTQRSSAEAYEKDTDPAENYPDLPEACRLANGLGIAVVAAAICAAAAVAIRSERNTAAAAESTLCRIGAFIAPDADAVADEANEADAEHAETVKAQRYNNVAVVEVEKTMFA